MTLWRNWTLILAGPSSTWPSWDLSWEYPNLWPVREEVYESCEPRTPRVNFGMKHKGLSLCDLHHLLFLSCKDVVYAPLYSPHWGNVPTRLQFTETISCLCYGINIWKTVHWVAPSSWTLICLFFLWLWNQYRQISTFYAAMRARRSQNAPWGLNSHCRPRPYLTRWCMNKTPVS